MKAEILTWDEFLDHAKPGDKVLIQGAVMAFSKEIDPEIESDECRRIEVKYKKYDMELNVFRSYLTAKVEDEES